MRFLARPLLYLGVLGAVFGLSKYHADAIGDYDFTNSFRFAWAFAYVGLLSVTAYGLGLPDLPRTMRSRISTALVTSVLGALGISVVQLFVGDALLPRFVVFGAAVVTVPWFVAVASMSGAGRTHLEGRDRVVVVGADELAEELRLELDDQPEKPASIVASISTASAAAVGDRARPLVETVLEHAGTVLVLDGDAQFDERIIDQAASLHEAGVRVRTRSLFFEEWLGKLPVQDLGRVSLFFDIGEVHRDRFGRIKRLVDLVAGGAGMVALVVVVPVVFVGNLVGNRGTLFYRQPRVGRRGQEFVILKLRTMRDEASVPTDWTAQDDPRITRFGALLRKSHLDELPQMWNILKGDLSLVGPRPEQPRYVAELAAKLPYYELRHSVRPGLTGWAQVKYGYAGDERDALEKLQYDFHYLRRQSVLFDLRIVARTIRSVVGGPGSGR